MNFLKSLSLQSIRRRSDSSPAKNAGSGFQMKRFRLAWALWFLVAIHVVVLLAGFIAPYSFDTQDRLHPYAPPTHLHFVDCQGKFHLRPFVYVTKPAGESLMEYTQDC